MSFRRTLVPALILAAALAACGGRADVDVATVPSSAGLDARQTELAAEGATRAASEPTATATAAPAVRPSSTPLSIGTPCGNAAGSDVLG